MSDATAAPAPAPAPDDASIGQALGAAGACPVVEDADGKLWSVGWPTQRAKGELEQIVVQAARQNLNDLRGVLPEEEWEEESRALRAQLVGRHWQTWGSLWSTVTDGPDGLPLFMLALMRPRHPKATIADAKRLWLDANEDCRTALAMVVPDFFEMLAAQLPAGDAGRRTVAARARTAIGELLALPTLTD
jgi:hypothetical protein